MNRLRSLSLFLLPCVSAFSQRPELVDATGPRLRLHDVGFGWHRLHRSDNLLYADQWQRLPGYVQPSADYHRNAFGLQKEEYVRNNAFHVQVQWRLARRKAQWMPGLQISYGEVLSSVAQFDRNVFAAADHPDTLYRTFYQYRSDLLTISPRFVGRIPIGEKYAFHLGLQLDIGRSLSAQVKRTDKVLTYQGAPESHLASGPYEMQRTEEMHTAKPVTLMGLSVPAGFTVRLGRENNWWSRMSLTAEGTAGLSPVLKSGDFGSVPDKFRFTTGLRLNYLLDNAPGYKAGTERYYPRLKLVDLGYMYGMQVTDVTEQFTLEEWEKLPGFRHLPVTDTAYDVIGSRTADQPFYWWNEVLEGRLRFVLPVRGTTRWLFGLGFAGTNAVYSEMRYGASENGPDNVDTTYIMQYTYNGSRFEVSPRLEMHTDTEKTISVYIGVQAGIGWMPRNHVAEIRDMYVSEGMQATGGNPVATERTYTRTKGTTSFSATVPMGITLRFSKDHSYWSQFSADFEVAAGRYRVRVSETGSAYGKNALYWGVRLNCRPAAWGKLH